MSIPTPNLGNNARLRKLAETQLMDSPSEAAFDRLTEEASSLTGAPVALISLVDDSRQFFKAAVGLGEPWASLRQTPLTHSFCQYVVETGKPLDIQDAREHPWVSKNLAIPDLGVISYLGVPLTLSSGETLGSFCIIDSQPRRWTPQELEVVQRMAQQTIAEIEARGSTPQQ